MDHDTTDRPQSPPLEAFDPASLLISHDFAWEDVVETRSATFCMNVPFRGIERASGRNVGFPVPCDTYSHQPCAERKVRARLRQLGLMAGGASTAYFTAIKTSDLGRNLLADRRYRTAKKLGRDVWYMRVDRDDGTTFVFSSDPLDGRKEPTAFYPTGDLLRLAAEAMSLPGVRRILTSRVGGDDDHADDKFVYLGFAGDVRFRVVERIAAGIAKERFGVDVNPLAPTRLEGGATEEQWIECMVAAWTRGRVPPNKG